MLTVLSIAVLQKKKNWKAISNKNLVMAFKEKLFYGELKIDKEEMSLCNDLTWLKGRTTNYCIVSFPIPSPLKVVFPIPINLDTTHTYQPWSYSWPCAYVRTNKM